MEKTWLMNVVYYDGSEAYVSKFIGRAIDNGSEVVPTPKTEAMIGLYLVGKGDILKIDPLYTVSLEGILAMKDASDCELRAAYDSFGKMWF